MPDLFTGGRYIQERGHWAREIEEIHGDDVHWRDSSGSGRCSKQSFYRWLGRGSLAPDSPPPPITAARRSKITQEAIERARNDAATLQNLKTLSIEPETDSEGFTGIFLWSLRRSINRIQEQVEDVPCGKRLRAFTRIDTDAQSAQSSIIGLSDMLKTSPAPFAAASVSPLLQALSDGLESVNRLRADLAPYLGQ